MTLCPYLHNSQELLFLLEYWLDVNESYTQWPSNGSSQIMLKVSVVFVNLWPHSRMNSSKGGQISWIWWFATLFDFSVELFPISLCNTVNLMYFHFFLRGYLDPQV